MREAVLDDGRSEATRKHVLETQKLLLFTPAKGTREPDGDDDADDDDDTDAASSGLDEYGAVPALSAAMSALNVATGAVSALQAQFG